MRAIAWNLLLDHRVSEPRAEHFYTVTGQPQTADALRAALLDYHRDWVCQQPTETYLSTERNEINLLTNARRFCTLPLAHVLNVSSWVERLRSARDLGEPDLGGQLALSLTKLEQDRLAGDDLEMFIEQLLQGINAKHDQRPIWVARWRDFKKSIEEVGAKWNEAVGAWRRRTSWQIVLKYHVRDVPNLIRPTQLDAGHNAYHFPSPPHLHPMHGGLAQAICELDVAKIPLICEWIHPPIEFHIDQWRAGGRLLQPVTDSTLDIRVCRAQHVERLQQRYGPGAWPPLNDAVR